MSTNLCDAVGNLLQMRPDLQVTIYSGHLIKEQLGSTKNDYLAENTSLWIAQYTTAAAPSWPTATWPLWSLWQYTDKATVDGITKPVDGNASTAVEGTIPGLDDAVRNSAASAGSAGARLISRHHHAWGRGENHHQRDWRGVKLI